MRRNRKIMIQSAVAIACAIAGLWLAPAMAQEVAPAPASANATGVPVRPGAAAENANAGATPIAGDAVYKAFHEQAGIQRIIDDFIGRVTTDPRIERRFAHANLQRLNLMLVQQICYLTGGPCTYTGKDIKSAHAAMGLNNDDFNALAEDLQLSMDRERVSFTAQNRLLAKLAPMQRAIVTR
jgi:hemoglobin